MFGKAKHGFAKHRTNHPNMQLTRQNSVSHSQQRKQFVRVAVNKVEAIWAPSREAVEKFAFVSKNLVSANYDAVFWMILPPFVNRSGKKMRRKIRMIEMNKKNLLLTRVILNTAYLFGLFALAGKIHSKNHISSLYWRATTEMLQG